MTKQLTLASLFDGSGGFPLAARNVGIRPVWASEIEPFPILVTTKRLPEMAHLGDVSKIHGGQAPAVDVVTFGSPCTDLSVAGSRAGLAGKASSLFFQATRIIEQMREASNGKHPRFAVWENVPGAFSSNQGHDFAKVLTTLIRICHPGAPTVPVPKRGWPGAGSILADRYSLAWRVLDAQYFGLSQRRRRIFLVADFRGSSAPEVLFEPQSLSRNPDASQNPRQDNATTTTRGTDPSGREVYALNTIHASRHTGHFGYLVEVAKTLDLRGGSPTCNQGGMIILQPTPVGPRPRRLTPLECARLQGFPDNWAQGLEISNPTGEQVEHWVEVWNRWNALRGVKPKTIRQVRSWLASPTSDTALFKMWGNGVALPVVEHILTRLQAVATSGLDF